MWKVEIESPKVDVKNGTSAKSGKPYSIREQVGWIYAFDNEGKPFKHAQQTRLTLPDDQPAPYPVGVYVVHPASIYIDRWGQASIKARLMPLADFQNWLRSVFLPSIGSASATPPARVA